MIQPTNIKHILFVAALMGISFYAGMFWKSDGHSGPSKNANVPALESRIAQLETELQTLAQQNQALQVGRSELPASIQSSDSANERDTASFVEQPGSGDAEGLAWARDAIWSENANEKLRAIEALIRLSPAEAVDAIRLIMAQAGDGQDVSLVALSLRNLANNQYLLNADLKQFYSSGDEQLQREAAGVLAQRGDESLEQRYINEQYAIASQDADPMKRAQAVQKLTAFGKNPYAASRILPLLADSDSHVRLKAVSALAYTGDYSNIAAVQSMLNDDVAAIRQRAEEVISVLTRNTGSGLILIPPPRVIADGLPSIEAVTQ